MSEPNRPQRRPRGPRVARGAEVVRVEELTPNLVRVFLTGPDLEQIPELEFTDHYIKILFPPPGADYSWPFDPEALRESHPRDQWPVTRTYTIRSFDRERNEMAVDFVVHGSAGLAGPWAAAAQPGDTIGFFGPGGAYQPQLDADVHLLVGDEAALPAIAVALEMLPADARAEVFLEVVDADHQIELTAPAGANIHWVHRGQEAYGVSLAHAVREAAYPQGVVSAFVHGNAEMIRDLRRYLFTERGIDRSMVSISGYWRTNYTEDQWQATKREFVEQMEAEEAARASA